MDATGAEIWTRQFGGTDAEFGNSITRVGPGSIAVGGMTLGMLPMQTSLGDGDGFVRLYDDAGAEMWTRQLGTSRYDEIYALAADQLGHIYATGRTNGSFPGHVNAGQEDVFILQLDAATGATNWARQFGTSSREYAFALGVDALGNVFAGGSTGGALSTQANAGGQDAFLMKLDVSGALQWVRQFGTSGLDRVYAVAVDDGGNVIAGGFSGTGEVRKFDSQGRAVWTKQFEPGASVEAVSFGNAGQIVVAGGVSGALPGQTSFGASDGFVRLLLSDGTTLMTQQFGTAAPDYVRGVAINTLGQIYVSGQTDGTFPGQTSAGNIDAFVFEAVIPEPASTGLIAVGALGLLAQLRPRGAGLSSPSSREVAKGIEQAGKPAATSAARRGGHRPASR